ncbi:alpha/beta hydrolase [Inconstantimicrobium mannanitabidum]|uniref:Uncharacterized protein n=1 Tax=Inconstantimicrobium mannanitabidum TaxID=1604901 RepID=A0ACB5RD15_9CLOT|nr:alpha/beta hydrolase-fold protein [Clostridium sp. TW13]GKX66634.1 hypothetical protein rsdtw13_18920 [Clostridium sp. TW13]
MEQQELQSKILMDLLTKIKQGDKESSKQFLDSLEKNGAPLIENIEGDTENNLVTFIYKAKEEIDNVLLISPVTFNDLQQCKMEQILDTNLWYKTLKIKNELRIFYYFSINDSFDNDWERRFKESKHDEFNDNATVFKNVLENQDKLISYVIMPNAKKDFWTKKRENSFTGAIHEYQFESKILNNQHRIRIYIPYNYDPEKSYSYLLLTDGNEYIDILSAPTTLDNLILDEKIPPIVAIFIDSYEETRRQELRCSDNFGDMIVKELIPWVRSKYNISNMSSEAVIGGLSLGGLTASYVGLKHSEVFGNVLSQSGSYWYDPEGNKEGECWLGEQYNQIEKLPLKFYLNVGVLENEKQMIGTNVKLRDMLLAKGYDVYFEQFNSGHDYLSWGETLASGLISLIGFEKQ